ncbi:MAG: energy-coupling factor ABC transporter ATP-binding protein [Fusobacteriaceae bacterium]
MENIIEIKNLNFKYKNENILSDISLNICKGEIIALAGKNGSGKSTLGKLLVGLVRPISGDIYIFGKKYNYKNISLIRGDISLVFQNPNNQIIGNKVIDDLAFSLENRGISREKMREKIFDIARQLKIEELLFKNPNELSGGQKQIVAIAGILVFNPPVIIFDEITSMLDLSSKKVLLKIIEEIKKNHTIILITHDPEELILANRIALLDSGKLVTVLPSKEFFKNSQIMENYSLNYPLIYEIEIFFKNKGEDAAEVKKWLHKLI